MQVASLPVRERGLKCQGEDQDPPDAPVAPRAGAWIEMANEWILKLLDNRRSPCGSVD